MPCKTRHGCSHQSTGSTLTSVAGGDLIEFVTCAFTVWGFSLVGEPLCSRSSALKYAYTRARLLHQTYVRSLIVSRYCMAIE